MRACPPWHSLPLLGAWQPWAGMESSGSGTWKTASRSAGPRGTSVLMDERNAGARGSVARIDRPGPGSLSLALSRDGRMLAAYDGSLTLVANSRRQPRGRNLGKMGAAGYGKPRFQMPQTNSPP